MSECKISKEDAINLLKEKYESILKTGENRFPKRSDFSEKEVVAIKAFLGPWPRALEAAGLKEKREGDQAQRNRDKRILAKRKRREAEKASKNKKTEENVLVLLRLHIQRTFLRAMPVRIRMPPTDTV